MSTGTDSLNPVKLRLHYWNCRGRVQAVRYMLEDIAYTHKHVDYKEDFELIDTFMTTWPGHKADQTISGPYRTLPVLHWNETHLFGQTLTIAHVLARKFDLYGKITPSNNDPIVLEGFINGVVTCAYTDVMVVALRLILATTDIENKESPEYYSIICVQDNLQSLNTLLKQSSTTFFYDQSEPTVADYFAFEAYLVVRDIHPKLLPTNCQTLEKLEQIMKQRPALANYFNTGRLFKRFTGAPHEDEYMEKLSKIN